MKVTPDLYQVKLLDVTAWSIASAEKLVEKLAPFKKVDFITVLNPVYNENEIYYQLADDGPYVLDKNQIVELSLANIKFEIAQVINVQVDITQQLIELAEKPVKLITEGTGDVYNNKCEVHMPGNMMAMYNEVCVIDDSCTDLLQEQLQAGWRIIAACPQPNQRRPDYVLGRFSPHGGE